jgi:peptide/nickel transport system ATP-binding protein
VAGSGTAHLRGEVGAQLALRVEDLVVEFPAGRRGTVHAVSGVSFDVLAGETLGVVGESGCGKTTVARAVMQLTTPTSGSVALGYTSGSAALGHTVLTGLDDADLRRARRRMQMIFQDPVSSLNPSRTVRALVREGLDIWFPDASGADNAERAAEMLEAVGLDPATMGDRRPHELSGGQCQRVCIARALVMDPAVLILDEPVSALDVSVQAQILNLLEQLRVRFELTMLFVSHDLGVVKNISDRVMVMYLGKVCEVAPTDDVFARPAHPYTRALLASIPGPELGLPPASDLISGELPSPLDPPSGCRFRTRCPLADETCVHEEPALRDLGDGRFVACHHA